MRTLPDGAGSDGPGARARSLIATGVFAAGTFVFQLSVPVVSPLAMVALGAFAALVLAALRAAGGAFLLRLLLLGAAVAAYYGVAAWHGFLLGTDAAAFAAVALAAYVVGRVVVAADPSRRRLATAVLLSGVLGATLFAAASVAGGVRVELGKRFALSLWNRELVAATALGALASLGQGLGAVLLFGGRGTPRLVQAAALLGAGFGLYANLKLSNRAPLLAVGAVVATGALVHARERRLALGARLARLLLVAVPVGLVAAAVTLGAGGGGLDILERFRAEGLESARYNLWTIALGHLFDSALGGRVIKIPESYMHNLWLDAMWDAGLPALGLLLAFHLAHLRAVAGLFRSDAPMWVRQVFLGLGVAMAFTCVSEPVLAFRNGYFGFTCAYLAILAGIRDHAAAEAGAPALTPTDPLPAGSGGAPPG